MKKFEERILRDGVILDGDILKVDSFVNHQIDVPFMCELGREFYELFKNEGVTKILTIEASGIGIACLTAQYFGCPVVFAKKSKSSNIGDELYSAEVYSYTHKNTNNIVVSKKFLNKEDKILIIDDFLATGNAFVGLIELCDKAGAEVKGCGAVIEKMHQGGRERVAGRCRVVSLAAIESMTKDGIVFAGN